MRDTSGPAGLVFSVPYVPTLGPMHPDTVTSDLWGQVVENSGTGRFLAHDKDARWGGPKGEHVLVDQVRTGDEQTAVPTLLQRGKRRTVRVHLYGDVNLDQEAEHAAKLAADLGAEHARLVRLTPTPQAGRCCRIQLRTFGPGTEAPAVDGITELDRLPSEVRATWPDFAEELAGEGFAFLAAHERAGTLDGPVLTVTETGRIVGAIGPMATRPDPLGHARLLPQYFGVLPEYRGRGHGRTLWRAAMAWGYRSGADYQLLQTEVGGTSDRLCRAEGLVALGMVTTITV
ncbi:GNAT superfamily N-acetyltransferase [Nocardiopsis mwathae]|uniref:GNAT superfamily N-acetyltransferase n=1 Tax=Nocardiopsis mwathae TaxID=1472723 RepID=A0A7W9YMY9_9ACTN|nr:GNAT family N-acetyltransferase [Nocardiopsis mwathae]MBB6175012.1 GNAT superfamily N-acetyltransferase [Nocardiopsis mwathae]